MKINRKFKRKSIKDNKGYLKSNEHNYTPKKEISGGDITMDGVDIPILAIPMGEDGPMDMKFMNPGEDYEFGGATKTVEIPVYKRGGKSKWISDKISTLVDEGKPQKQAIAIAYSMWENKMKGGKIGYAQNGMQWAGAEGSTTRFNAGAFGEQYGDFGGLGQAEPSAEDLKRLEQERLAGLPGGKTSEVEPGFDIRGFTGQGPQPGNQFIFNKMQMDKLEGQSIGVPEAGMDLSGVSSQELGMEEGSIDPTQQSTKPNWHGKYSQEEYDRYTKDFESYGADQKVEGTTRGIADFEPDKAEVKDYSDETTTSKPIIQKDPYQLFNPYAGVDIPSAAYLFGQNVGKGGNPLTAVASGLKLATGLGRNIAAGVGNNKRTQYGLKNYRDDLRDSLKGPVEYAAQDGGEVPDPYNDKQFSGLKFNQTDSIPGDISGEWVKDNFFEVAPGEFEAPEKYTPNMGRYKPVGYFEKPVIKDNTINFRTTDKFRGNRDSLKSHVKYLEEYNPGYKVNIDYVPRKQAGGKVPDPYGKEYTGMNFEDAQSIPMNDGELSGDWVKDNFFEVNPSGEFTPPEKYKPNMGKFKPVGYFRNPVVKDSVINLETTDRFPGNRESMRQYTDYLEEYNPGYKVKIDYKQDGGTAAERNRRNTGLKFEDAQSIPMGDDSELSGSWVRENFFSTSPGEFNPPSKYKANMGKYKPVGYFKPAVVKDSTINLETTNRFPGNRESIRQYTDYLEEYNPGYKVNINIPKKQDGGVMGDDEEVSTEAMLTGNYSTEDLNEDVNVEVEENEYILTPQGSLTKVLGDTHEKGGEKMALEEGSMIISDHLKLGGKIAKKLTKALDTPVGSTDTYAKAMDKFYKKSGLQDIIDEEVEVMAEVKKQKETLAEREGKDEATFKINQEFLSGKLNELNQSKEALMEGARVAFGKVFDMQESTKNEKAPKEEFQVGGKVLTTDQVIKMAEEQGMDKDRALGMMRAMCGGKKHKYGGYKKGYGGYISKKQDGDTVGASIGDPAHPHPDGKKQPLKDGTYGGVDVNGVMETIKRNSWWFDFTGFDPTDKKHVKKFQTEFNKRVKDVKAKVDVDGKFGIQTQSALLSPEAENKGIAKGPGLSADILTDPRLQIKTPASKNTDKPSVADVKTPAAGKSKGNVDSNTGMYLLPGQEPMPPTGLIMPTKIERQYGRMDAERFTPDELLAEIKRSELSAAKQLDTLPSGTREGAIVKMAANSQAAKNKVINQVEVQNKQLAQQEEAFNIRQSDREVDAGAIDTLSYEQRAQGAMANTTNDFERFFNESQSRNMANFRTIEDMNFMNALYENFDITAQGIKNTNSPEINWAEEFINKQRFKEAVSTSQPPAPKKKGSAAKKGGKVARVYKRKNSRVKRDLNFEAKKKKTRLT